MRWLILKDLQVVRRSRLLLGLLVVYPAALALMIGGALSSPPGRPRVALFSEVPPGSGRITLGRQQIDVAQIGGELRRFVNPVRVGSRQAAVAAVREGRAQAALILPADIAQQVQSLVTSGLGSPTVELFLNSHDPLERDYVQGIVATRLAAIEQTVSQQVLRVAIGDLRQVLDGGRIQLLGQTFGLLGLRNSRTIVQGAMQALPPGSPLRPALRQVVAFANLAIAGLGFADPVLGSLGQPLAVRETQLSGATTPTATYAAAIAVTVAVMIVALLLASALLALERAEGTYARVVRGAVRPGALLGGKAIVAGALAAALGGLMSIALGAFVHLRFGRAELWIVALVAGGGAFAALGAAIGALAREVAVAALLVIMLALPVAFVALVPATAVSGGLRSFLDVVAFAFPFRATLQALANAFSGESPGLLGPVAHLAIAAIAYLGAARLAVARFASR